MNTYLIMGIIFVAAIGTTYAIAYLKGSKKAGNIDNVIKEIDTLSPLLAPAVSYLESRLPEPLQSKAKEITGAFGDAATMAESAWKNGELTPDSRKQFATEALNWGLRKLNIKPTDIEAKVLSTGIDLVVSLFIPKSNVTANTTPAA